MLACVDNFKRNALHIAVK